MSVASRERERQRAAKYESGGYREDRIRGHECQERIVYLYLRDVRRKEVPGCRSDAQRKAFHSMSDDEWIEWVNQYAE